MYQLTIKNCQYNLQQAVIKVNFIFDIVGWTLTSQSDIHDRVIDTRMWQCESVRRDVGVLAQEPERSYFKTMSLCHQFPIVENITRELQLCCFLCRVKCYSYGFRCRCQYFLMYLTSFSNINIFIKLILHFLILFWYFIYF